MPYAFQLKDQTLQSALRRIADEELSAAAAHLAARGGPDDNGVHDIRKRIKKVRSLLRLLRDGLDDFARENAALRDVAAALSGARDEAVLRATFDALVDPATRGPGMTALRDAVTAIEIPPRGTDDPAQALDAIRDRARQWTLDGADDRILAKGLSATRRRGRVDMRQARKEPLAEVFHDWRKRSKDLWYQSRLLVQIWPEVLKPLVQASDILGESLGHHHDLSVLSAHLDALPGDGVPEDLRADLRTRIAEAQDAIAATAFPLSARLFAGDPDAIADQWVGWWKTWRRQAPSSP